MPGSGEVTALLEEIRSGNREAESELIPLVYDELHRIAGRYMRQARRKRSDHTHTLQTTALINEAYFLLLKPRERNWENRNHFFAIAAMQMRQVLVDYARKRKVIPVISNEATMESEVQRQWIKAGGVNQASDAKIAEILDVDRALRRLATEKGPRPVKVVELRYFAGFTFEETAAALKISTETAKRDWKAARAWLSREIGRGK